MTRSLPFFVAAHCLERAAHKLNLAADELDIVDPETALSLRVMAADLSMRAARLEADDRAEVAEAEHEFAAYDLAHPV